MSSKEIYKLKVYCRNCGKQQEKEIPFGVDIRELGDVKESILMRSDGVVVDSGLICENCGSLKLSKALYDPK